MSAETRNARNERRVRGVLSRSIFRHLTHNESATEDNVAELHVQERLKANLLRRITSQNDIDKYINVQSNRFSTRLYL